MKKDGLAEIAHKLSDELCEEFRTFYDESGAIGRRYRRQDEVGTPFCVTVDYQTKDDQTVTIRFRDSMEQVRVKMAEIAPTDHPHVHQGVQAGGGRDQRRSIGVNGVFDTLKKERGFVSQCSTRKGCARSHSERVTFYIGFDPTAESLHIGHLQQLMFMAHLQRAGHRPIALVGGGTTRIGDPTGRTESRKIMPVETIAANAELFRKQISRFLDFSGDKALMLDNAPMARAAELHRVPSRHRGALLRQQDAFLRNLQDAAGDGPLIHRVQLPAPPVL